MTGNSYLNSAPLSLDLSIVDLAVINDNGITTGASGRLISPANALGELSIGVGQEQLITEKGH